MGSCESCPCSPCESGQLFWNSGRASAATSRGTASDSKIISVLRFPLSQSRELFCLRNQAWNTMASPAQMLHEVQQKRQVNILHQRDLFIFSPSRAPQPNATLVGSWALPLPKGADCWTCTTSAKPLSQPMGNSLSSRDVQAEGTVVSICLGIPTTEALQYCAVVESIGYCIVMPPSTPHNAQCPLASPDNHSASRLTCHHTGPTEVIAVGMLSPSYRGVY